MPYKYYGYTGGGGGGGGDSEWPDVVYDARKLPDDGNTHLLIVIEDNEIGQIAPPEMTLYLKAPDGSTIDWGDGSTDAVTGTTYTLYSHVYAKAGEYCITFNAPSGYFSFGGNSSSRIYGPASPDNDHPYAYHMAYRIRAAKLANGYFSQYCFAECHRLETVCFVKDDDRLYIQANMFLFCESLKHIKCKQQQVTVQESAFRGCVSLRDLSDVYISIASYNTDHSIFKDCYCLESVNISDSYNYRLPTSMFENCRNLKTFVVPDGVTGINGSAFYYCRGLQRVTIGSGVASIGNDAFSNCTSLYELHINRETPPTLSSNSHAFYNISPLKIYVPSESVDAYKTATNWTTYADKIYPEPET